VIDVCSENVDPLEDTYCLCG